MLLFGVLCGLFSPFVFVDDDVKASSELGADPCLFQLWLTLVMELK
jgi:hypothetical protein